jgi:hypothetical protein
MNTKWLSVCLVLWSALLASPPTLADYQRVLTTPTRIIVLLVACQEGELDCQHVIYVGIDRVSGLVTQLKGTDWVRNCPRQDMPCQHVGFKFPSNDRNYYITDDGSLTIQSNAGAPLITEHGKWVDIEQIGSAATEVR